MRKIQRAKSKREKGQVLVIVALLFIGLIAIVGLAIDMGYYYVSYARLRRAVDGAALAATSQFKKGYTTAQLVDTAMEFMELNDSHPGTVAVETCENTPSDTYLCATPRRKLVRVRATETVPLFFLSVIGFRTAPVTAESVSEAASLEVVLTLDRSESMGVYKPDLSGPYDVGSFNRDPKLCNENHSCHPFNEVKDAARNFADKLYYPYDRVAVVTFDQVPLKVLSLTNDRTTILNAIDGLTIYEGIPTGTGDCGYDANVGPGTPIQMGGPCRAFTYVDQDITKAKLTYERLDCPADWPPLNDPSYCQTTNIGGGLRMAASIFSDPTEAAREEALWVTILLTDGVPNAGYDEYSHPVCPEYTWTAAWSRPKCRDKNALVRHCYDTTSNPLCTNPGITVVPGEPAPVLDSALYDADDYARDQADILFNGVHSIIFAIGLGPQVTDTDEARTGTLPGTPAHGATLLQYIAMRGDTDNYYQGNAAELNQIFLAIANRIATRLTR